MPQNQESNPVMPTGVSMTALLVAQARAQESARSDRLFEDPLAQAFVAAAGSSTRAWLEERFEESDTLRREFRHGHVAIRTRFFDDYLLEACAAGCRQVAVLAAGLDSRSFRLPWPEGVHVFELDLPEIFAFKEQVLATEGAKPVCQRIVVEADLTEEWSAPLMRAGFRPEERTAWLAEGILPYLTEEESNKLLEKIGNLSAVSSELAFDHTNLYMQDLREIPALRQAAKNFEELGVSIGTALEDPQKWLVRHGWQAQVYDVSSSAGLYNRAVPNSKELFDRDIALWLGKAVREGS